MLEWQAWRIKSLEIKMMKYSIEPSALAYLFGDVLEDVFVRASRFGLSQTLPCREVKVKKKDLAKVILAAAFVHLAEESHLKLTLGKKGRILKSKAAFAALSSERPGQDVGGLEGQVVNNITGNQKKNDVGSIVSRLLGTNCPDPWGAIIGEARTYLVSEGYFVEEERRGMAKLRGKKLIPKCERIATLEGKAQQLREMMATFQARQPELYRQLWKGAASGIASRQEAPDVGVGDAMDID